MKKIKIVNGLIAVFVSLPISLYLQYKVLTLINASELMWFLFWANIPFLVFIAFVSKALED